MSTTIRSLVAAAMVAGIYAAVSLTGEGSVPTKGTPPQQDLADLPRQLGDWQGEDQEMDQALFRATGAASVVNRHYTNPAGETVNLHATVTVFSHGWNLPHPPPRCYTGNGYTILDRRILPIELPDGTSIPAELMSVELAGQRSYLLYWYQIGREILCPGEQMRQLAWTMRGKEAWPPVLKIMMTNATQEEYQAIAQFKSIATPLAGWAGDFR